MITKGYNPINTNAIQRTFIKPKSDRYFDLGDKTFHDISDLNGVFDYFKGSLRPSLFEQYPMGLSNICRKEITIKLLRLRGIRLAIACLQGQL